MTDPGMTHLPGPVEIRVEASISQIPPLRAVASDLAARADFDIDAIADLRMAVDEASATLVALANAGGQLCCCFQLEPGYIVVTETVAAEPGTNVPNNTFGWRVLTTLMDRVEVFRGPVGPDGGQPLGIRMWRSHTADTDWPASSAYPGETGNGGGFGR